MSARTDERADTLLLARLVVTVLLIGLAGWRINTDPSSAFAGAVVGYVSAHWLPAPLTNRGRSTSG